MRRLKATKMLFYGRVFRISWTEHTTNEEVLRIGAATRKRLIKFGNAWKL